MDPLTIGLGIAGLGSAIYGASQSKPGEGGVATVTYPEYSFTEPRLQTTSDYIANTIARLGRGEYPAYYERAVPGIQERMRSNLYRTYFGDEGSRRGAYNLALETGAIQGVGPKAARKRSQGVLSDYSQQSQAIDQFIEQLGVDIMRQESQTMPQISAQLPQGPRAQAFSYQSPAYESPWLSLGTKMLGSLGTSMAGGGGGSTGSTGYFGTLGQGNQPGTGIFGTRIGGQTQSEILGIPTTRMYS